MTPAEKAYFKKYGFKKEGTGMAKMIAMFNICERQSDASQFDKVEKQFEKAGIDRVPLYRNRLFEALVQSLRDYQASKSDEEDVYHKYQAAGILIGRGLLKEADSILTKAIAKADSLLLLEHSLLLEHKRHIVSHALDRRQQVSEGIEKRRNTAVNLSLQMQLNAIYEEVYNIQVAEGRGAKGVSALRLKQLAKEVELIEVGQLDVKGTIQRNSILHTIYFNLGENEKCVLYSAEIVALFDQNPTFKAIRMKPYLLSLYNYLSDCLNAEQPKLYLKNLPMLGEVKTVAPQLTKDVVTFTFNLQLDYLLLTGGKKQTLTFLKDHLEWYSSEKQTVQINTLLDYICRLAYLLYKEGLYDEALDQVVEFFNVGRSGLRPDLELQVSILEMTIHFELGHKEVAFYKQKALYQRSRNNVVENAPIVQFIGCMSRLLRDNRKDPEAVILQRYIDNAPPETDRNLHLSPLFMIERLRSTY